ncbi:MAG TPA: acetyl xylan esterase, partial [Isosphaeraceae bacterium]|nr:acetyl xylan esterase [Isosphaeraceae bacterium]
DMVGYNDSKPFPHAFLNDRLRHWGLSLPTLQTWDSIRALDWLSALPDVDPARIGCTGESGGGTQTFLLTALDDRITVSAPVVMVSDTFQGGCACENAAGLRLGTDNVEFAAMCAPRPLILVGATGDWTAKTMERAFPAIRGVYSLVGSIDRVQAQVFDFPHNYNQTSRNAVYAAMGRWLLGIDDSAKTKEGPQQPEKPEALFTFDAQHPAPPNRKTPEQLEAYLIETLRHLLDDLSPASGPARWEAARRLLLTSLKVRTGIENPPADQLKWRELRHITREGLTIVHGLLGRASTGDAVPVVRLIPARPSGRLTILAHPTGKAALATASGAPTALVRALLARGQDVVGFDPLFVGESLDPREPIAHRPEVEHFETYNPAPAADQMQDLATVLAWVRAQPEIREVSLVAQGLSGYQALVARPVVEGLARTVIELADLPPSRRSDEWPATIDLPGVEQFGGVKAAAALAAPAPLWLFGNTKALDASWPRTAYQLAGASHLLRIDRNEPDPAAIARWVDQGE